MHDVRIKLREDADIIAARSAVRGMGRDLGFGLADQARLATAVSELAHNVIKHAEQGCCVISVCEEEERMLLRIVVEDNGSGLANVDAAVSGKSNNRIGFGMGLPGVRRLMDEFEITSRPGCTRVSVAMHRRKNDNTCCASARDGACGSST